MYVKLTNQNMETFGGFKWKLGKWQYIASRRRGQGYGICTSAWFHCYDDPLVAVLLNPIQGQFINPRLFRVNVRGLRRSSCGGKFGFTCMRLVEELPVAVVTTRQRVAFGILAVSQIVDNQKWQRWASGWLAGQQSTFCPSYTWLTSRPCARHAAAAADEAKSDPDGAAQFAAWAAEEADAASYGRLNLNRIAKQAMLYK